MLLLERHSVVLKIRTIVMIKQGKMLRINSINLNIFLLGLLMVVSIIKAEYETLSLTLVEENGNRIVFNWQKTEQLLLNKHMPLWIARYIHTVNAVHHEFIENFIPDNIGNFILYRDLVKSSAIVYFENSNSIFGEIGQHYLIHALPLEELNREHLIVGSQYITRRQNVQNYPPIEVTQDIQSNKCYSHEMNPDANSKVTILYPEILILITHDILAEAKRIDPTNYYAFLVIRYIMYFNTISMLFDKLSTESIKIHINIAGIIVEGEHAAFPFTRYAKINDVLRIINARKTLLKSTPKYLRESGFNEDSFDFFFISTGFLLDNPIRGNGFSTPQHYIYHMRIVDDYRGPSKCLGSIVYHSESYPPSFTVATQRIAWMMNIKNDMVDLQWNAQSLRELQKYARVNKNHCYLLNYPRSLHPYGRPVQTLAPSDQCICYGYQPSNMYRMTVGPNGCNQKLLCELLIFYKNHCANPVSYSPRTPLPIDGTPCDVNKVCWKKTCRDL